MPIDSSIALGIKAPQMQDPRDSQLKSLQLQQLVNQGRMEEAAQLQAQQDRMAKAESQQQLGNLYRQHTDQQTGEVNAPAFKASLANLGRGSEIAGFEESYLKGQKSRADIGKTGAETAGLTYDQKVKQLAAGRQSIAALRALKNPQPQDAINLIHSNVQNGTITAEQGEEGLKYIPRDAAGMPEYIDKALVQNMNSTEQLKATTPTTTNIELGGKVQEQKTNPLTGETTLGKSYAKTATAGELLADARAKHTAAVAERNAGRDQWQVDTANNRRVNKLTGETQPLTEGGVPLGRPAKENTAEQNKATTQVIQATNAWKTLKSILADAPDASEPGALDALAGIPSMGLTSGIAQTLRGDKRQMFLHAAGDMQEAALRAATGAGFGEKEAADKAKQVAPQIGDSKALVDQKMKAFPVFMAGLTPSAGPNLPATMAKAGLTEADMAPLPPRRPRGVTGVVTPAPTAPAASPGGARPPLSAFQK